MKGAVQDDVELHSIPLQEGPLATSTDYHDFSQSPIKEKGMSTEIHPRQDVSTDETVTKRDATTVKIGDRGDRVATDGSSSALKTNI